MSDARAATDCRRSQARGRARDRHEEGEPRPAALAGGSYRLPMQTASKPHNFYTRLLHFSSRIYMRLAPNCLPQSAGASGVIDEDQLTWSSLDSLCRTLRLMHKGN